MTRLRTALLLGLALSTPALATDQPIAGTKLLLKRSASGKESLVFLSKDPAFLFPAIGSLDDPATGSPGGALLELFADAGSATGAFAIPPGLGKPGWAVKDAAVDQYKYSNSSAPAGPTPIKVTILKQGKLLKIVGKGIGLPLTGPQGGVSVRLTVGSLRSCARFEGANVVRDQANLFLGKNAPATALADCTLGASPTLARPADPVVMTGAQVPTLVGIPPGDLVAFRWSGAWQQIPVQVDERKVVNYTTVYNGNAGFGGGVTTLGYADAGTFTGADPNTALDGDDEIAFMARDAGSAAPSVAAPAGVIASTGVKVTISDPSDGGVGYAYLFRRSGALPPGAGQQYVTYAFSLASGPYLTTYNTSTGPNPESSTVTSPFYQRRFTDRWIQTELHITAPGATGVDILDRHRPLFGPGVCGRSEDTFSAAEGAFVVNKSGPVRALRSYVGANSGPLSQREHVFYERREDIRTSLRVHAIPGIMDLFDYAPAATGMLYRNNNNTTGVLIDGNPDTVTAGLTLWELVTGVQGSLTRTSNLITDIGGLAPTSYYLDDSTPPIALCTGDAFAYGISGAWINQALPNTDPRTAPFNSLRSEQLLYFDSPGLTVADAQTRTVWALTPLAISAAVWP
ncbi:MAG TPA: hypothetical protein VGR62_20015 [Candidatus Binatia bacterium]|jgi:hypothetical protein|nr:hypothetical protein [Candidatus Binatia bacterium]